MTELRTVLMVVHDFPPMRSSGIYRPLKFAKYLPEFGWKAHVLTVTEPTGVLLDYAMLTELPVVTKISRAKSFGLKDIEQRIFSIFFRKAAKNGNSADATSSPSKAVVDSGKAEVASADGSSPLAILKRFVLSPLSRFTHNQVYVPDIRIGWKNSAIRLGREIIRSEKIDAIFSTSAPETSHLIAQDLHQSSGLPWIVEFRDPWYQNFTRDFYPSSRLARELRMQKRVMKDASAIVYGAPRMRDHNRQTFPELSQAKQFVIPNGYDEANFGDVSVTYSNNRTEPLRIVHVGTVYERSTFRDFLAGLELYYRTSNEQGKLARLVFVGEPGATWDNDLSREPFKKYVDRLGFRPHQEAVRLMREADVLLLTIPNDGLRFSTDYNIPGKVFELIRAGRPILMIGRSGDTADIVNECNAGEVVAPESKEAIAQAIIRLAERKLNDNLTTHSNFSALAKYDRRPQAGELARILNLITENSVSLQQGHQENKHERH